MTVFKRGAANARSPGVIERAAAMVPCHPAMIAAFIEVEAAGSGFWSDGRLKTLPEPHWLYRLLPDSKKRGALNAGLAIRSWSRSTYSRMFPQIDDRYAYLEDVEARYGSEMAADVASWGAGQVMGFNAEKCGYSNAAAMYRAFADSEDDQIISIVKYLMRVGGREELQREDCRGLARIYNGSGQVDVYGPRLEQALKKHKRRRWSLPEGYKKPAKPNRNWLSMGDKGKDIEALQETLVSLGYFVEVDGDFGPATQRAVRNFQHDRGLKVDGLVGADTIAELKRAKPAPVDTDRATATGDELLEKGSSTVRRARQGKLTNVVTGGLASVGAVGSVLEAGETARDNAERAGGLLEWILPGSASGWIMYAMMGIALLSILGWIINNKMEKRRIEEHRSGKNLSVGGL